MKPKTIINLILIAFVAVSAGWLIFQQGQGSAIGDQSSPSSMDGATASGPEANPALKPDRVIIVYYFYTTYRCPTCHKIENYTMEVVKRKFEQELKDGRMEFHAINVEEQGNEHFVKDYELHTKSVVVSEVRNGKEVRWKNLANVWKLVGNKDKFFNYIEDEVNLYLKEK